MNRGRIRYSIKGMHCASCEAIIESKIGELKGVESVSVSRSSNSVTIEYGINEPPKTVALNNMFRDLGYSFFNEEQPASDESGNQDVSLMILVGGAALAALIVFYKLGINTNFIDKSSSLGSFVIAGLIAGFSTCAAMSGSLVLAMSKKWAEVRDGGPVIPSLTFNLGRITSYLLLGGLLGFLGERAKIIAGGGPFFTTVVSLIILAAGLNILGVKIPGLNFKSAGRLADKISKKAFGKYDYLESPIVGALTFFLPCGFTISAQAAAIASADWVRGALIMGLFALGTAPALFSIGSLGGKLMSPKSSKIFSLIIGFIIIAMALSTLIRQMNVLGIGLNSSVDTKISNNREAKLQNGIQVLDMNIKSNGYSPSQFQVKVGAPVKWRITNPGVYSCASAILAPKIFEGLLIVKPGEAVSKEFVITSPGTYRFYCSMGMYSGIIKATL